jgi:PAS domain S-box-containing protein
VGLPSGENMLRVDIESSVEVERRTSDRYRALVKATGDIVWTNSPDGEMRGAQLDWCAYTGQTEEEAKGYGWSTAVHADDARPTIDAWKEAVSTRSIFVFKHRVRRHDGVYRWFAIRAVPVVEADGSIYEWVGLHRDVEEEMNLAERERAARRAAEEASRAKDDFFAMLGHELRNPLAPIATAVHLLKLRSDDAISREVSVIERQSQHLARLVDDLLDVARIASGKVVLNKDAVGVADLVAAAIETASPAIENGRLTLVVEVPKHGLVVDVDRVRMTQVVANLLTNAAKYTPGGGRISVRAASEGTDVVISVEDTGVGISAELLPSVFDLFVQARQTLDRAQGGLGLGLALVRNLVGLHGGTVTARSPGLGHGSTFTVRLPRSDVTPTHERRVLPPIAVVATHEQRVLVVDDNEDGAEMLAEALQRLGYRTAVAHDGLEAIRVATEFDPHVALLDIGLPVLDGFEVATRLRARFGGVKLVAITGYAQESDRQKTQAAGFQAHLTKPVDLEKLAGLLANLFGK